MRLGREAEAKNKWDREHGISHYYLVIQQVIDKHGILASEKNGDKRFYVLMDDTSGLYDDKEITIRAKKQGTYSYGSVLGSKSTVQKLIETKE